MAEDSRPILDKVDASATDTLLSAVSSVGENAQIVVVIRNADGELIINANIGYQDSDWLLRQALHSIMEQSLGPPITEDTNGQEI